MNKTATFLSSCVISASTMAAFVNMPQLPVNESPLANATDVSKQPLLQATTPSDTIAEAQWIVYPKSDVQLIGGYISEEVFYVAEFAEAAKQLVELGYQVELNNAVADAMWVYPNAIVELVNTSAPETVIARIDMEFDTTAYVEDEDELILVKSLKNGDEIVETKIEWHLKDSGFSPEWNTKIQAIISKQAGFLGVKVEQNDLNSGIWVSSNMDSNIGFSGMGSENNYASATTMANSLKQANNTKFSLACVFTSVSTDCDRLTTLNDPDVHPIEKPSYQQFLGLESQFQVETALDPLTEYEFQVRYWTEVDGNYAASNWSKATTFTTEIDTSYSFTALNDAQTLRAGEIEEFRFWVKNNGNDTGRNVSVQFMLPFNVLEHVNGSLNETYNATLAGEACSINVVDGKSYFKCVADTFPGGELLTLEINALIPASVGEVLNVYYHACDVGCEDQVMSSAPRKVSGTAPKSSAESEEESSAGSLFWLLLGLPLVLRRRG